ncbi:MAG: hypothetical protein COW03_15050 [Cytophagales bacterium CG12_big_fil_rev_8_21_14_0_65_40_12]|nr:MAG: hypothetical protein COW03_15050 [Cytophagales bacterium CG12_big_fil_rev_8_21_14_0_65_40_12]PIW05174.1 MAG: hypothetical protein COW40_05850 [Cytophagales bacterium CG17_big_fil_post_rev_8_21_14_2_50_40_13]
MKTQNTILNWMRRAGLFAFIILGTSTVSFALPNLEDEKLTKKEAMELVAEVKEDLKIQENPVLDFIIDEEGNILPTPIKIIRIYDNNDELLLEAPIHTLDQMRNKELRRLVNASDYLTSYNGTFLYQLNID